MSHHCPKPPGGLSSFITSMLTYGVGSVVAGGLLFWVLAFLGGAVSALRPKAAPVVTQDNAPVATAPIAATTGPGEPLLPAPATIASTAAPAPAAPVSAEFIAMGQRIYSTVCIACHQPAGMGLPGMFPPLGGSDWVNVKKPDRMIRIVLHGFTGAFTLNGQPFSSPAPLMPPQGGALGDEQIAAVLTYVRNSFGNKSGPVSPAEVKAIRDAEKTRTAMWTEAEILKIPVE